MTGTSNIPALEAARPGLEIVASAGVAPIRGKSQRQTARLIELADRHNWRVNTPRDPEKRGGTVSIDMPQSYDVCRELRKPDTLIAYPPNPSPPPPPPSYTTPPSPAPPLP